MERSKITWSSFDFSNETDFEEIIIKKDILKNYFVYDAKKTLNIFRKYNRYADVLLIQKNFKYWSIGEIEISKHSFKNHIFPQLNSFCNVNLVQRLRDSEENYIYINDDYYTDLIKKEESYCYINDIVLIIDYPNLLGLDKLDLNFIEYKGEKIHIQQQFGEIDGTDRLFWIMETKISDGKYKLKNDINTLKLNR